MDDARDESFHARLTGVPDYAEQVAGYAFYPPRAGRLAAGYDGPFADDLERLGITPFAHQARALIALGAGQNVVVATPTASGKSLVYQLPTLRAAAAGRASLYLFPTKALAHDQLGRLTAMATALDLQLGEDAIASYDGDTPEARRARLRDGALVALTNPDMLHYGVLPYHARWAGFLSRLDTVVLDELHSYRGVFGTHVANVLRRLLRLARHYGADPRLVAASATIGNPRQHAEALTGEPFTLVDEDEAPRGAREFILWQPPEVPGGARRRSATSEAADLAARFVRAGIKSIFFCNSRKVAELLRRYAGARLSGEEAPLLQSYRAGYSSEDRRLIEAGFKNGDIRVLTATSALELGMDIGGVDAVVLVGYPGSKMALWQRSGRAGRERRRALTLLIPGNDPLDEYYLHHPELLTEDAVEDAVADPFNSELHPLHVACAAAELPIRDGERGVFGPDLDPASVPGLHRVDGAWSHMGRYPHRRLRIRGQAGRLIRLRHVGGRSLGSADLATALRELHPGAVYLHQGEPYQVVRLDLGRGIAELLPHIEDYYTQPRSETDIEVLAVTPGAAAPWPTGVHLGRVRVATNITAYVKKRYVSGAVLEERPLDLPELSYPTQALWFSADGVADAVAPAELPGALHALEHTLIGLLPAFVLCERADVGGVSYPHYPATGSSQVFIYDGYPGGVGYARAGASQFVAWLRAARDLLERCPCESGCPRCVLSPKCGNGNQYLDKHAARRLAAALLARLDAVPAAARA
ncbi:MAG TPA: DEAD/DEAH box helicase [Trueperaceae bacterium]|nr:DEAD/DEAH box helicase [Trueperaceae bacterium]